MSADHPTANPEIREIPHFPGYGVADDKTLWSRRPRGGKRRRQSTIWFQIMPGRRGRASLWRDGVKHLVSVEGLHRVVWGPPEFDASKIDPALLAWVAGFFDGEGSVSVRHAKRKDNRAGWFMLRLTVTNTHVASLERIREIFGFGSVHSKKIVEGRKPTHDWYATDRAAERFIRAILPYSVTKREQLELAIRFRELGQKKPFLKVSPEHYRLANEIAAQIRALNGANYRKDSPRPVPLDYVNA